VLTTTYPRWQGDSEPAFVHFLSRELVKHDLDVHVLAPHCKGALSYEELDGVTVHRFRYLPDRLESLAYEGGIVPKLKRSPWLIWQMPFLFFSMFLFALADIRKNNITHIHAHWVIPQGLIAIVIKKIMCRPIKVLVTSHGADLFSLKGRFFKIMKIFVLRKSDAVSVVSEEMKLFCQEDLHLNRDISVSSMGIDTECSFFDRTDFQDRNGFLFVGRLVEKKGVADLLYAFQQFLVYYPKEKLTIVGDGFEMERLKKITAKLEVGSSVFFAGAHPVNEVAEYLNKARFFVMPSKVAADGDQEGLGLVAAESLASGCISLVSDLPAINDVHNEPFLKFSAGNVESLLSCMLRCYEQQGIAKALANEQKTKVIQKFSWDKVAVNYCNLLK
jgi:glycosyltransferase involved in cell wall biosynthesis